MVTAGRSAGGDHLASAPAGRALHDEAVRVEQLHVGPELVELEQVDRPVLEHPVMDHGLAVGRGGQHGEEGKVVDVEAGEGHRVDLVRRGLQLAGIDRQVDQAGESIARLVLAAQPVVQAHLLAEDRQFDLGELDRHAGDGEFRLGHHGGGDQAHGLDRVLTDLIGHVHAGRLRQAPDGEGGGTHAIDLHPEQHQEGAQVLHHVVGAGIADDTHARRDRRRHQGVLRHRVTTLGEHDVPGVRPGAGDAGAVEALGGQHVDPEVAQ